MAPALSRLFGVPGLSLDNRLISLLAFIYTYHYLNWFIKAEVIRWADISRGRLAIVAVSDTGVGMNPTDAERIFEPFVRLDAARGSEVVGAGLGLSIVHSIVLAHDGNLSVQTALGVGSTFAIRLPLA